MPKASPWLMILLAATFAITPFAVDTYLPAMPIIAEDLGAHIGTVQQSLSVFLAAYAAGMLVFGPLADKLGRKPLALFGLTGFAIASLLLGWVRSIDAFLVCRALQAFCGAAATVIIPGFVRHLYQEHTAKGMSYMSLMMMLAPLLAPSIGSGLLLVSHWQTIFLLLFCYALTILVCVWRFLPDLPPSGQATSFFGNYRTVFSRRDTRPLIATVICSSFSFFCYLTAVSFVYIQYFGVSAQLFGLLFAINICLLMLSNFINSRLVTRLGSPTMVRRALALAALLATALSLANWLGLGIWYTVATLAPLMGCLSMISTNTDAMIVLKFPEHSGTATAVTGTLRYGFGALAGPVLAATFTGTALPFSLLMLAGVAGIALCQLWFYRDNQTAKKSGI